MTRLFLRPALAAVATLSLFCACDGLKSTAGCDFRQGSTNGPEPRCQEYKDSIAADSLKQACQVAQAKMIDGPCPREGIVAGCDLGAAGDGTHPVDWYYATGPSDGGSGTVIQTRDDVKRECGGDALVDP